MFHRISILAIAALTLGCKGPAGADGPPGADGEDGTATLLLEADTAWSEDTVVEGVWRVAPGVTLTVADGVEVRFLPGSGLFVEGALVLEGSASTGVSLVSASPVITSSQGIHLMGEADDSVLDHASFRDLNVVVEGLGVGGISGATFNNAALYLLDRDTGFTLDGATFTDGIREATTYVIAREAAGLTVSDSSFELGDVGISFNGREEAGSLAVSGTTFAAMEQAVVVGSLSSWSNEVSLDGIEVSGTRGNGVNLSRSVATVRMSTFTDAGGALLLGDGDTVVDVEGTTLTGAGSNCLSSGGAVLSDVGVSDCDGAGVRTGELGLSASSVDILRTRGDGIYGADGSMVLDNVIVDEVSGSGVEVVRGDLQASQLSVSQSGSTCVQVGHGDATLDEVGITGCESQGIYLSFGVLTGTNISVTDPLSNGVYGYRAGVDLTDVAIDGAQSNGVFLADTSATITRLQVTEARERGLYASGSALTLDDATIVGPGSNGVYLANANATVRITGLTVSDAGNTAVYSTGHDLVLSSSTIATAASYGVFAANGDATLDTVEVSDTLGYGVYAAGHLTMTDSTVDGVLGSYGVLAWSVDIDHSEVLSSAFRGIYVSTALADSTITSSDIRDSGDLGILVGSGANVDVSTSNLVGNAGYGVQSARLVDGCYVADNKGQTGVDTTENGAVDGTRSSSSAQIYAVDAITNPSSTEIADAGPR